MIPLKWPLYFECLGLPMKDGGRITFLSDLMSFRLLAVVISSQKTIHIISGRKSTVTVLQGLVRTYLYVSSEFGDSEESPTLT